MKPNEEIIGNLCKQVNMGDCTTVAFAALERKDDEIAKEKELLKQDLLWHIAGVTQGAIESMRQVINEIVDKHFLER
jgi:hypothetical protein